MASRSAKIKVLPISKHINRNFRTYALYTLESRGIPRWEDSLTNVQRLILLNSPANFEKTISVGGKVIQSGYHHGDAALFGAINRLARPYGIGYSILEGDGFFGSPVNQEAAAARYTSVRINSDIREIVNEYKHINDLNGEGIPNPFHLSIPVGLLTNVVGIAVGYKTTILPRKLEHIQQFLSGKRKSVSPYFHSFKGTISKRKEVESSWLIEGLIEGNKKTGEIHVTAIPPLMKYESFIRKLSAINEVYDFSIINSSKIDVDILVKVPSSLRGSFDEIFERISKITKMIVTESIVFVRDGDVLCYENVENYLLDFADQFEVTKLESYEYWKMYNDDELEFLRWKLEYLKFMYGTKRGDHEIDSFFDGIPNKDTVNRLNGIRLRNLSKNNIQQTEQEIADTIQKIEELSSRIMKQREVVEQLPKALRSATKASTRKLFDDDEDEIDGIEVFNMEEEEQEMEN